MTRLFWDTIVLISGYLFTFGAGPNHPTIAMNPNSTSSAANTSTGPVATGSTGTITTTTVTTTTDSHVVSDSFSTLEAGKDNSYVTDDGIDVDYSASNTSSSAPTTNTTTTTTATTTITTTTRGILPVKKFVAVHSHFDDCPDSHLHFCIHGTCRFLILEETPACVCHAGFVGMRCEHADLLAVVATNHKRQTVATVLVLCVIGCVLTMLLCTLLHCWLQQECLRRRRAHHCISSKHGASYCLSASVV